MCLARLAYIHFVTFSHTGFREETSVRRPVQSLCAFLMSLLARGDGTGGKVSLNASRSVGMLIVC